MTALKLGRTGQQQVLKMVEGIMDDVLNQRPSMGGSNYGSIQGVMMDMQLSGLLPNLRGERNTDYDKVENYFADLQRNGNLNTTKDWYRAVDGLKSNDDLQRYSHAFDKLEEKLSKVVDQKFAEHKNAKTVAKSAKTVFGTVDDANSKISDVIESKTQEAKLPDSKKVETPQEEQTKTSKSLMDRIFNRGSAVSAGR